MKLIDKYGQVYHLLKKNDNYYLAIYKYNPVMKKYRYEVDVKGKRNIEVFIRNNGLVRYEDEKIKD